MATEKKKKKQKKIRAMEKKKMAMEKKKNEEEPKVLFSDLPDVLVVHILSFLDIFTAAQTSFLCKRFKPLWLSLPSLIYRTLKDLDSVVSVSELIRKISKGKNTSFGKIFLRFQLRPMYDEDEDECMAIVRKLIRRAFESCSGELELSFTYSHSTLSLDPLLSSAAPTFFTSIKFINCNFNTLHGLFSSCPLLQELSLVHCQILTPEVRISGTQLRALVLDKCQYMIEWNRTYWRFKQSPIKPPIHIDAKNLQRFSYTMGNPRDSIVFTEYPDSLKILTLGGTFETRWLEATIPKFIALECLSMNAHQPPSDTISISSLSLKRLALNSYSSVTIDCPMLKSVIIGRGRNDSYGFKSMTSLILQNLNSFCNPDSLLFDKLELLRQLKLISCAVNGEIHLSHKKLERLYIWNCSGMVGAHIDTPRLHSFTYCGQLLALKSFNHSTSLEVDLGCSVAVRRHGGCRL